MATFGQQLVDWWMFADSYRAGRGRQSCQIERHQDLPLTRKNAHHWSRDVYRRHSVNSTKQRSNANGGSVMSPVQ